MPVLVNETVGPDMLATLLNVYRPAYVWLPAAIAKRATWGREVYRYRAYVLLMTRHEARYDIHADLGVLVSTSGSTGSPKLVRQSYRGIQANTESIAEYLESTDERPVTTLPMSYVFGLSVLHSHLHRGARVILTSRSITEKAFWDRCAPSRRPRWPASPTPTRPSSA